MKITYNYNLSNINFKSPEAFSIFSPKIDSWIIFTIQRKFELVGHLGV